MILAEYLILNSIPSDMIKGKVCTKFRLALKTLLGSKIKTDRQIIQLKPSMNMTAEIKTSKRRVIEYLLSPVMKYLNESMRER